MRGAIDCDLLEQVIFIPTKLWPRISIDIPSSSILVARLRIYKGKAMGQVIDCDLLEQVIFIPTKLWPRISIDIPSSSILVARLRICKRKVLGEITKQLDCCWQVITIPRLSVIYRAIRIGMAFNSIQGSGCTREQWRQESNKSFVLIA